MTDRPDGIGRPGGITRSLRLGLVHTAVAVSLVPINGTLNRVMIGELGVSATLVALLATLPYLFSPLQVAIGSYTDRHPVLGLRRTPAILAGMILCAGGMALSPVAAYLIATTFWQGLAVGVLAFGAWGMGYNLAAVSYLALATEVSEGGPRGRTVAIMWTMMIVGIIASSVVLSLLVTDTERDTLLRGFGVMAAVVAVLGLAGLVGLERRLPGPVAAPPAASRSEERWTTLLRGLLGNPQARRFFLYLALLLSAVLGQDILLEPFAGEVLGMPVSQTTRISSVWGVFLLGALFLGSLLERRRIPTGRIAAAGAWGALAGLGAVVVSGVVGSSPLFWLALPVLGFGTGLCTLSNLSLMLDMTVRGREGLYIGLWGVANALSRIVGSAAGGLLRDLAGARSALTGYVAALGLLFVLLAVSLGMLKSIDVPRFHEDRPATGFPPPN